MADPVRVGVVDSGWPASLKDRVEMARSFAAEGSDAQDRIGHGSRVLQAIAARAPEARLCVAQVFGEALRTDGTTVARALDWLVGQGAAVINLSLGVRQDLRCCARALAQGCLVIAESSGWR